MIFDSDEKIKLFWENFPLKGKEYAQDFLDFLKVEKSYSLNTLDAYLTDLKFFLHFCSVDEIDYLKIESHQVRSYFASLNMDKKLEKKSQRRKLSGLRTFYHYLFRMEIIPENPILEVKFPKVKKTIPKNFSPIETEDILNENNEKNPILDLRNKAIIEIFYSSGMRVFELVNSKWDSLSSDWTQMKILGKRNKERYVFLGEKAIIALKNYKDILGNDVNSEFIFLNFRGKKITTRGVQFILEEYRKKMGWEKKITPHKFRHTFATDLLNEGADIRHVQELLGHSSLSSTQIYLSVSKERLKEVYRKSHPHAKLKQDD